VRLLHVTPFYEPAWGYGGTARAAAALCRALAALGHEVIVTTALLDPAHPHEEGAGGLRVRRFPSLFRRRLVPWAPGLRRFLAELGPVDVAHLHGHRNGMAVTAADTLAAAGVPFVLQPHGSYPDHGQLRLAKRAFDRTWGSRVTRRARAWLAVSRAEARDLPAPADVVGNGVEWRGASARRTERGAPTLLFVGNDRPQKRGQCLPALLEQLPAARLHVVGTFAEGFRRRFRRFGVRVRFHGVLGGRPLADAYASADLLVHPAVGESFGLAPFEAALFGTPAVVGGGHGCGEWYGRAGGCVVPPDDARALAQAVAERLADHEGRRREAGRVADFARRELGWPRVAAAVEGVYRRVLGQGD
jgi:glycosyltransferase involved in cell wall biosynthesis